MQKKSSFFSLAVSCLLLAVLAVGGYFLFHDTKSPQLSVVPDTKGKLSPSQKITVTAKDEISGIRSASVVVRRGSQYMTIINESYAEFLPEREISFTLADAKLPDGGFDLEIKVNDGSYASFGVGNVATITLPMRMDNQPPKIAVKTVPPNIRRGGSALIVYTVSEEVRETGVKVGEYFFPAYPQDNGSYICLFAFPYFFSNTNYEPEIMAQDTAGNVTSSRLLINLTPRTFPDDIVNISDNFLKAKDSELKRILPGVEDALERYKRVNTEVRHENDKFILEKGKQTQASFVWKGAFQRQPKSALKSNFGDSRTYMYNGEKIDYQVHTGFDLASVAQDTVRASNVGTVIFADYLGIYGNTVIVDHGRGLQTLYAHLTEFHVKEGDEVGVSHDLGTTGVTGLAVGDHVHFSFLVGGIPVQPAEWFDAMWVRNNITNRMKTSL